VGQGDFVVRQGDCISSIAKRHGHLWETIWDEPANAELRQVRQNPNVLLPDDRVTIPPNRPKSEQGAAEMRHRFRKKGQPETYQVRVLREDKPRGNEPYELDVDGKKYSGVTDADGNIVVAIAPDANYATLTVGTGENEQTFHSQLGEINPLEEVSGVQQRLNNLGFECGPADGELGDETRDALRIYQKKRDLPVTGEPDEATRRKLQDEYGC
jgi:hypothetical protein